MSRWKISLQNRHKKEFQVLSVTLNIFVVCVQKVVFGAVVAYQLKCLEAFKGVFSSQVQICAYSDVVKC